MHIPEALVIKLKVRNFAKVKQEYGEHICCVPCKDLSFVKHPTVVGLGDAFVGGLVLGLL